MKKNLPILLSTAMALSIFSSSALAAGAGAAKSSADFIDLKDLDTAAKVKFDAMISAGIFDGVAEGTFGLKDKMNRAQYAKVAALIFGLKVNPLLKASSFSDVSADDTANGYALPYIEALKTAKLTDGYGENTYNPAGEVTKEQLAAFLLRGLNKDAEAKATAAVHDGTVSDWAKGYAALAVRMQLLDNEADGTFGGTTAATRDLLVASAYAAKPQYVPVNDTASDASGQPSDRLPAAELTPAAAQSYAITNSTNAQVKSVLEEKTPNGWRIGAVVKLNNTSGGAVRIPDYELRGKASDGTVYTLQASASNPRSIPPQGYVELSYMAEVDVKTDVTLTDLLWVDVNQKTYPKQETVLADAPIGAIVWRGKDAVIQDPARLGNWGVTFPVPGVSSGLKYSASSLSKQFSGQSPTYLVQLKVVNSGGYAETVPDFTLSGQAEGQSFVGKRVEQAPITLNSGEQKYIHYAVTTEPNTKLTAFYVLTPESFLKPGQNTPLQYYTGRIGFKLPASDGASTVLPPYQFGTPIAIDPLSQAVNPKTSIALQELAWFENDGQSYKTAIAPVKYTNHGDSPIPVPQLSAELVSDKGVSYSGTYNSGTVRDVLPGMGAAGMFTFTVPKSEEAAQFAFRLLEQQGQPGQPQSQPAYNTRIAAVNVPVQILSSTGKAYPFYPYEVRFDSYNISSSAIKNPLTGHYMYSYKLEMGVDVHTMDEATVDPSNPKLLFQLEGPDGKRLGSKTVTLAGDNRLMSGNQTVLFESANDQMESPISVKVYEVVSTPYGDARRLLTVLKN